MERLKTVFTAVADNPPFFFKQWGGVRKDLTGRELDGGTYDEMPHRFVLTHRRDQHTPVIT